MVARARKTGSQDSCATMACERGPDVPFAQRQRVRITRQLLHPICWLAPVLRNIPISIWSATSPIFPLPKGGSIWPSSWIDLPAWSWGGNSPTLFRAISSPPLWTKRSPPGQWPQRLYSIPIAAANTPLVNFENAWPMQICFKA